jgi:hypothetical protein
MRDARLTLGAGLATFGQDRTFQLAAADRAHRRVVGAQQQLGSGFGRRRAAHLDHGCQNSTLL